MARTRAVNRSNRWIAKKRRKALRSSIPGFGEEFSSPNEPLDSVKQLKEKDCFNAGLIDLLEPESNFSA